MFGHIGAVRDVEVAVDKPVGLPKGYAYVEFAARALPRAANTAGETTVRRYGGIPPYRETKKYVKRVMSLKRRYGADFR